MQILPILPILEVGEHTKCATDEILHKESYYPVYFSCPQFFLLKCEGRSCKLIPFTGKLLIEENLVNAKIWWSN